MSALYCLKILPDYCLDDVWRTLEKMGASILYSNEDEKEKEVYAYLTIAQAGKISKWKGVIDCVPFKMPMIDWEKQWSTQNEYYSEGFVTIDFSQMGVQGAKKLLLQSGPGFGDFTHPTTRLMVEILIKYLRKQVIVDIGCGSGILTLAATALGATKAYGIDIDSKAIEHSRANAAINNMEKQSEFFLSHQFKWQYCSESILVLMNMIETEQQVAWRSLNYLEGQKCEIITSGILAQDCDAYLKQAKVWGWELHEQVERMGWCVFYFKN